MRSPLDEIIRVLMIFLGGIVLISLLGFLWPLIKVFLVFILIFGVILYISYRANRRRQVDQMKDFEDEINREFNKNNDYYQNDSNSYRDSNQNDDVIDVEYTEREVDDGDNK